jgi:hypothetical protein
MNKLANWFAPLLTHHLNESAAMNRAAVAKEMGLDPEAYGSTYPGATISPTTTTITHQASGVLKGIVLGAALLGSGGVLSGLALTSLFKPPGPPNVAPGAHAAVPMSAGAQWEILEQQQPDGTWKEIGRWREGVESPETRVERRK